jgi:hypothetical protein
MAERHLDDIRRAKRAKSCFFAFSFSSEALRHCVAFLSPRLRASA